MTSTQFPAQAQVPKTRLVVAPEFDPQVLTNRRNTDCRGALTYGLAEYLETLQLDPANYGGRGFRFAKVFPQVPQAESEAVWPAAYVYAGGSAQYDAAEMTPQTRVLPSGLAIRFAAELTMNMQVEIWSRDPVERMALVSMCEDAFDPVDYMTGFILELPHYHGVRATYECTDIDYLDVLEDDQKRWRKAVFTISGTVPKIVALNRALPEFQPRFDLFVDGREMTGDGARS